MKNLRKLISTILSLALVFTVPTSVFAENTSINPVYSFTNATVDTIGDTQSNNYTEIITLPSGEIFKFEHSITFAGNTKIIVSEPNNISSIIEFNPNTQELFMDGILIEKATSVVAAPDLSGSLQRSNWNAGTTQIVNYYVANFTLATLAAAIAGFTGGPVSAIAGIISIAYYESKDLSAIRTTYLNYVDYSPKIGGYYDSIIYSAANATGALLGTTTSTIFVR